MTTASPLEWPKGWPRTPSHRRKSRHALKATFAAARDRLYRELQLLGAGSCVISCNLELRMDGSHKIDKSETVLADPGVAVYFSLRDQPMVIASDRYETPAANLRSIGLAIEHLRGLERHGGGHMMERAFGGFTALPPPSGGSSEPVIDWKEEFGLSAMVAVLSKPDLLLLAENRYRSKAKEAHADTGGSNEAMIRLNAAISRAREELGK